eukprot:7064-Heterococcus_DN1.PRE.2
MILTSCFDAGPQNQQAQHDKVQVRFCLHCIALHEQKIQIRRLSQEQANVDYASERLDDYLTLSALITQNVVANAQPCSLHVICCTTGSGSQRHAGIAPEEGDPYQSYASPARSHLSVSAMLHFCMAKFGQGKLMRAPPGGKSLLHHS